MASLKEFTNMLSQMMKMSRGSFPNVSPTLLSYTAVARPGISSIQTTSNVVTRLEEAGIPADNNSDGTDNVTSQFARIIVEEVIKSLKNDCKIQVAIPFGAIKIMGNGGNAGGPVVVNGFNTNIVNANGVLM